MDITTIKSRIREYVDNRRNQIWMGDEIYLPANINIAVSANVYAMIADLPGFRDKLKGYVKEYAAENGYSFISDPKITLIASQDGDQTVSVYSPGIDADSPTPEKTKKSLVSDELNFLIHAGKKEVPVDVYPFRVGRAPDNDLSFPEDGQLSLFHVIIDRDEVNGNYFIIDNGSRNGTWVDGERISKSMLRNRNTIELGKQVIDIRIKSGG